MMSMKTTMSMTMMMMMTKKKYEAQHSAGLVVTHPSQIAPNELRPTDAKAENNKNRVRLENTDQHNAHYVKKKKVLFRFTKFTASPTCLINPLSDSQTVLKNHDYSC